MSTRVLKTTREMWAKELENETIESHPMLKLLQANKRIKYNAHGTKIRETIKNNQLRLQGYADMDPLTFARKDLLDVFELGWRGYKVTDAISEFEKLQNKGESALIKLFESKAKSMEEDANEQLPAEFYVDGNLAANSKRLHGIESFMGVNTGAQVATDVFATTLSDSYGGISTVKGALGGTDSTDPRYDFWSPVIVSTNRTGKTWANNAETLMRDAFVEMTRSQRKGTAVDMVLLTRTAYKALVNNMGERERVIVDRSDVGIRKFGFRDVVNLDGVDVTFDPDIPATDVNSDTVHGYGFTTSKMELQIMGGSLWHASGDAFDEETQAWRFWIGFYGNLVFKPRHFAKFVDLV